MCLAQPEASQRPFLLITLCLVLVLRWSQVAQAGLWFFLQLQLSLVGSEITDPSCHTVFLCSPLPSSLRGETCSSFPGFGVW